MAIRFAYERTAVREKRQRIRIGKLLGDGDHADFIIRRVEHLRRRIHWRSGRAAFAPLPALPLCDKGADAESQDENQNRKAFHGVSFFECAIYHASLILLAPKEAAHEFTTSIFGGYWTSRNEHAPGAERRASPADAEYRKGSTHRRPSPLRAENLAGRDGQSRTGRRPRKVDSNSIHRTDGQRRHAYRHGLHRPVHLASRTRGPHKAPDSRSARRKRIRREYGPGLSRPVRPLG